MSMCLAMTEIEKVDFLQTHDNLIHSIAQQFKDSGIEYEDLVQEIKCGFLKAIEKFDPTKGTKLSTFAVEVATNEILMILRKNRSKGRSAIIVPLDMGADDEGIERDSLLNQDLSVTDSLHTIVPDMDSQLYTKQILEAAMDILVNEMDQEPRKALILSANNYTQEEIAKMLKTSQSRVSKMIKLATCELRLKLQERGVI